MKLIVDVGNTRITFALFDGGKLIRQKSVEEKEKYSASYFYNFIKEFVGADSFDALYLSSVVPNITYFLNYVMKIHYPKVKIITITPDSKSNMEYHTDNPSEIGADIIADLAIGKEKYGYPLLVCDLGTASKVLLIDKEGNFDSCVIIPGMTLSMRSLVGNTALLPDIDIDECKTILAKNTIDAMNAGIVYSHLYGIEGICQQFEKEVGYKCKRIITGGCASAVHNMIPGHYIYDEDFILYGIDYLGRKNEVEE